MSKKNQVNHYTASYGHFASDLYAAIRQSAFGEDIGQNGWLTADEQDKFIFWLNLDRQSRFLDIACGSGGPTLRIARKTGCSGVGIDLHENAVEAARKQAAEQDLAERISFEQADASQKLPFADDEFEGLICIDAVNHLPDRKLIFQEWARVLKPGGRLVFTDPITITGPLTNEEINIRSSIGFFLFVPPGVDEKLLAEAGFEVVTVEDRTENMARLAGRWLAARQEHEADLRRIEGDETFEGQQVFFETAAKIAAERRLSRFALQAILK